MRGSASYLALRRLDICLGSCVVLAFTYPWVLSTFFKITESRTAPLVTQYRPGWPMLVDATLGRYGTLYPTLYPVNGRQRKLSNSLTTDCCSTVKIERTCTSVLTSERSCEVGSRSSFNSTLSESSRQTYQVIDRRSAVELLYLRGIAGSIGITGLYYTAVLELLPSSLMHLLGKRESRSTSEWRSGKRITEPYRVE